MKAKQPVFIPALNQSFSSVQELLANPKHWTTRTSARDCHDAPVLPHSKNACSFCLLGAIGRIYTFDDYYVLMMDKLAEVVEKYRPDCKYVTIFNDSSTHEQILEVEA